MRKILLIWIFASYSVLTFGGGGEGIIPAVSGHIHPIFGDGTTITLPQGGVDEWKYIGEVDWPLVMSVDENRVNPYKIDNYNISGFKTSPDMVKEFLLSVESKEDIFGLETTNIDNISVKLKMKTFGETSEVKANINDLTMEQFGIFLKSYQNGTTLIFGQ